MKIFAIRDDNDIKCKNLAYLIYFEKEQKFYIEIPDGIDEWEAPLLISSFVKRGIKRLDSYWSKLWVQQRIVPSDRQNLGDILRDNNIECYDEYQLLVISKGRCAQDDLYIVYVKEEELPKEYQLRMEKKVEEIVPLKENGLLVFFKNGIVKKCDLNNILKEDRFIPVRQDERLFEKVDIEVGGYGVTWGDNMVIDNDILYEQGVEVPLSKDDFSMFVKHSVINTTEATELLGCSRQNINDLLKRGKLNPIKSTLKNHLFLKSDIIKRNW
jgi:hypothetical protein